MIGLLQVNLQCSCVASGTQDKATKRLCILYEATDCLLQHAAKLSCYFVLGTEGEQLSILSILASDQSIAGSFLKKISNVFTKL